MDSFNSSISNNKKSKVSSLWHYIFSLIFLLSIVLAIIIITDNYDNKKTPSYIPSSLDTDSINPFIPAFMVIDIVGIIEYNSSVPFIIKKLKLAYNNDNIKAIILRFNSGGGTVGASQEIYHRLNTFKKKTKKPIISVFGDISASGAYYIACSSDYIFAREGSITGSIGVIIGGFTFEKLFKEYGVKQEIIKSGKFKDIGSSIGRSKSKEEMLLLQNIVNSTYNQFFNTVLNARKDFISKDSLIKYADGRIFNGENAKQIGLVDRIGGIIEATNYLKDKLNIKGKVNILEDGPKNIFEQLIQSKTNYSFKDFIKAYYSNIPLYLYAAH